MLRSRFFWKLYASLATLLILAVVVVGVWASRSLGRERRAEFDEALRVRAELARDLATAVLGGGPDAVTAARLRQLGALANTRITVIRPDGVVVGDSHEDPSAMDNHGQRPEILDARAHGAGTATRFSRTLAATLVYHARTIAVDDTLLGYVRTAVPLTSFQARLTRDRATIALAGVLTVLLGLVVAAGVARRMAAPLASVSAASESIASGDYQKRIAAPSRDEVGEVAAAFNRVTAELEQRVQTITDDRTKLLTILSGMVEGVVAVDHERRVLHLNVAAGEILNVQSTAAIGKAIWEIVRLREVNEAVDEALQHARDVTAELQLAQHGQDRVVELRVASLQSAQGNLVGAVLVLHDVTELRRLETVRQDFVANVSHELKTPITAIRGLIDTIVDDADMPGDVRDRFLKKIQSQSTRLALLVTDLLTLGRLESAAGLLEPVPLDLRETVRATVGSFRAIAEERHLAIELDLSETPVPVVGDTEALSLLANNLVDNAVKYTAAGGRVGVAVGIEGGEAIFEVTDTGIGIERDQHDRIFERFYRVDKARSRELGGTGLGLSIVKHISKAHGGAVTVESAPAAGSTFRVRLPLTQPAP